MVNLRKISLADGLVPPQEESAKHFQFCDCGHHGPHTHGHDKVDSPSFIEVQLASKPHRWPRMRKIQKEFFDSLIDAVTAAEVDMLAALKLPSIDAVRRSIATGQVAETGSFDFTPAMSAAMDRIIDELLVKIMGRDLARSKQLDESEMPLLHYYDLAAYTVGLDELFKLIKKYIPAGFDIDLSDLTKPLPTLDNAYLEAMIKEAGKRIKTRLALERLPEVKRILIDMARNRDYPMKAARYLHKAIGEGDAWYWNRIARSEPILAVNEARRELAKVNGTKYVEWSAGAGACIICTAYDGKQWKEGESPQPVASSHPHCFPFKTQVFTSKGYIYIGKIKIGDQVLTHTGRFQNVVQVHKHHAKDQKMVTIYYKNDSFSRGESIVHLTATNNHPFFINGKWMNAEDVKSGDSVRLLAKRCKECNKLIPFSRWRHGTINESDCCSTKCQMNLMHKEYGTEYLQKQFQENGKILVKNRMHHFQTRRKEISSLANSENSRRKYNTKAEQVLNAALAKTGLNYIHQYKIDRPEKRSCSIGGSMNRFYKADFYLPDHRLAIECDGKQWKRDIDYDQDRINYIKSTGIDVLQFSNEFVLNNTDECINVIQRMAKNHAGEYEFLNVQVYDVKHFIKSSAILYNLSVDEDESYIAKGFVVHNCGCVLIPLFIATEATMPQWTRDPYENQFRREELPLLNQIIRGEI